MKIICESCGAKYSVADSKVEGKNFKITCKKCNNKIVIKNKKEEEALESFVDNSQTSWDDSESFDKDDQATKIFSYEDAKKLNATSPFESNDTQQEQDWYVHINGEQVGPISLDELKSKIKSENLSNTTNVWQNGMPDWVMLKDVPEFASLVSVSDPFSNSPIDDKSAGFGNDSMFNDSDAESLLGTQDASSNSFATDSAFSAPSSNSGGFDLKSLIDYEGDFEDEEEDDSSKSKVIDFKDIVGSNPDKRIIVQQANFNAASSSSGNKKTIFIVAGLVIALLLGVVAFLVLGKEEKKYSILVSSDPVGASIKLNGVNRGLAGVPIDNLKPGTYTVTLVKENYKDSTQILTLVDANINQTIKLEARPVMVTLKTGLADAEIYVDGKLVGKTDSSGNFSQKILPAERVNIKISKDGADTIKNIVVSHTGMKDFEIIAKKPEEKIAKAEEVEKKVEKKEPEKKVTKRTRRRTHSKPKRQKKLTSKKVDDDLDALLGAKPKVKPASNLPSTLKKAQVFGVIKKVYPKVKACGSSAGVSGKVPVKFRINGSGSVSNIKVSSAAGGAKNCIYSKVRGMRFPRFSGKAIPVTFPFKL